MSDEMNPSSDCRRRMSAAGRMRSDFAPMRNASLLIPGICKGGLT